MHLNSSNYHPGIVWILSQEELVNDDDADDIPECRILILQDLIIPTLMTFNCGFECLWQQWWNGDQRGFIRFNHQSAYPTIHAWSGGRGGKGRQQRRRRRRLYEMRTDDDGQSQVVRWTTPLRGYIIISSIQSTVIFASQSIPGWPHTWAGDLRRYNSRG